MNPPSPSLAELFPDGDHEFRLTLRRAEPSSYFAPWDPAGEVRRERKRWLVSDAERHLLLQPQAGPLVLELATLAAGWGVPDAARAPTPLAALRHLGEQLEPDLLLLAPDEHGEFRLRGGALCFPTGWALGEKLGQTLASIHGVVPGLNAALDSSIQQFLTRLRPGVAYLRDNWGIASTDELNLHPARQIAGPAAPVELEKLWLRVEHQALLALPQTRAVVFGIRISLHRMDRVACQPEARRLARALATMPSELISYKRLAPVRDGLVAKLQ